MKLTDELLINFGILYLANKSEKWNMALAPSCRTCSRGPNLIKKTTFSKTFLWTNSSKHYVSLLNGSTFEEFITNRNECMKN